MTGCLASWQVVAISFESTAQAVRPGTAVQPCGHWRASRQQRSKEIGSEDDDGHQHRPALEQEPHPQGGMVQLHEMEQDHTHLPGGNQYRRDRGGRCGDAVFRQAPGREDRRDAQQQPHAGHPSLCAVHVLPHEIK